MAINVIGFRWGDSDENHKYDYEALENKPSTDLGVLDIDTTAEQGTDDGDLYRAIHSFSWDSVINTLSGILNVKKLFTNIINQVKTNKDALDDPGQILKDGIGSLSTSSSVISSDRFIIKENDGSIKQVTPLNTLRGGVRNLTTVVSFLDRFIPTISTSDTSEINKAPVSSVVRAGIYNLASGSASDLNENLSDSIVVQTEAEAGALDPAYVEKHTLSEIHDLFGIDDLKTNVTSHGTRLTNAESDIDGKVSMDDALFNLDTTQAPTTVDGALYEAITDNGWGEVISNQLMDLKKLLTNVLKKTVQYRLNQGTNTFTLGKNFRGKFTVYESSDANCCEEIIATTGAGSFVHKTVASASGITVSSGSSETMTLTVGYSGSPYVEFYVIAGTVTKQ